MEVLKQPLDSISLTDILTPVQMRVENIMRALSLSEINPRKSLEQNDMGIDIENWIMLESMTFTGADRESLKKELMELVLNGK
jgi:hypothetical protein